MVKSSASTPEAVNPKSNSNTVDETNKMIGYFNAIPPADCAQLLVSLREYDPNVHTVPAGYADTTFPHPARSLDDHMSQVNTACNEEVKNQLYEEANAKETQQKANLASTHGGNIPSHQLQSGLLISLVPCSDRGLNDVKVILQKGDRGADPIACRKRHDKVVKALKSKKSLLKTSAVSSKVLMQVRCSFLAKQFETHQEILYSIQRDFFDQDPSGCQPGPALSSCKGDFIQRRYQ
jgi:hypothetical protein